MMGLDIAYLRSRNMVGAHQNLNGKRDLTTPFQGWFVICGIKLATINMPAKFEVSIFTHY